MIIILYNEYNTSIEICSHLVNLMLVSALNKCHKCASTCYL